MDKLGTYALVAALKGLTESSRQQRRRESDRWISLQASALPQLDMTLEDGGTDTAHTCAATQDAVCDCQCRERAGASQQQAEQQQPINRPVMRTSYIRQLNERHDKALRTPRK